MEKMRECDLRHEDVVDEYDGNYDVGEAFRHHNIEYWIYDGRRLVPASPEEEERLRDWWAERRMQTWQKRERERARAAARRAQWAWLTTGLASIGAWLPRHLVIVRSRSSHGTLAAAQGDPQQSGRSATGASESAET